MTTTRELADELRINVSAVKQFLRDEFAGVDFSSPDRSLSTDEAQRVRGGIRAYVERRRGRSGEIVVAPAPVEAQARLDLPFVAAMAGAGQPRAGRGHRLLLHVDVLEYLQDGRGELRRLQAAVQRLMREMLVEGRAQRRVKSTKGLNAGWLRAPLGDNGGYHYYLWHALAGMRPVAGLGLGRGEVLLRAIRHHDETDQTIDAGARGDYLTYDAREYIEAVEIEGAADVLSADQRAAYQRASACSITKGHPGAGKTTLQLERTRRYQGRILFVTFGEAQREQARRWLETYAHAEQETLAWTHQELFRALDPSWQPAPPLAVAAVELQAALAADPRGLGPWTGHAGALYAELRAHVWGRTLPVAFRGRPAALDDEQALRAYRDRRSTVLDGTAVQAAAQAARALGPEVRDRLFGDLDRAHRVARALADGELPPGLERLDAVLLDEVQDLTLVEQLACALLAREAARRSGRVPAFHVAGDEGQTVRATDFDWGELKDVIHDRLGRPDEFDLPGNVRSPSTITRVINNSWALYKTMAKSQRPKGYAEAEVDETALGSVLWTELGDGGLDALCAVVAETPGAALVYPDTRLPDDVRDAARRAGVVHAAAAPEIKGLDFRVAFVLDVGQRAHALYREVVSAADAAIVELEHRTAVDAIRVAISRATEVLVFAERTLGRDERARLAMLCSEGEALIDGVVPEVPLAELRSRIDVDTADRNELVTEALADFDRTFADDPATGLRIIERARGWLGDSHRAGSVKGDLRRQVYRAMGLALLRSAIDRGADAAMFTRANAELNLAREPELARLALDGRALLADDVATRAQVANVTAVAATDGVAGRHAALILDRMLRQVEGRAARFEGKDWDRVLEVLESARAVTAITGALRDELVAQAAAWALDQPAGRVNDQRAARAIALMPAAPPLLLGRLAERRGDWVQAVREYREAGMTADALRVARGRGDDDALSVELARGAGDAAAPTLERLARVHADLAALAVDELTDHERQRLLQAIKQRLSTRRS